MDIHFVERLERNLEEDLPGSEAQFIMAPMERAKNLEIPDDHILACVLILIYPKNKDWYVSLIERNINQNDTHSGQLSFPGGRFNEKDYSYQDCALREAEEEIGVPASTVGVIGELSSLYVPISNHLIYPFVGFIADFDDFKIQKSEVSELLEVPIKHFLDQKNKKKGDIPARDTVLKEVPYYDIDGRKLWGATAMIMSEFEHIIRRSLHADSSR